MEYIGCWEKEIECMKEIKDSVKEIFNKVLSVSVPLIDETSSGDIHAWDSLNHVVLISSIEEKFNIKFELFEMLTMQSFGDICRGVEKKLNS
jgi:acyl carrier protein